MSRGKKRQEKDSTMRKEETEVEGEKKGMRVRGADGRGDIDRKNGYGMKAFFQ